jgi:hypothetical protein
MIASLLDWTADMYVWWIVSASATFILLIVFCGRG